MDFSKLKEDLRNLPKDVSIVPFIKHILLLGPPSYISPEMRASVQAWSEPFPTVLQIQETKAVYPTCDKQIQVLPEMMDLLVMNITNRELMERMKQ